MLLRYHPYGLRGFGYLFKKKSIMNSKSRLSRVFSDEQSSSTTLKAQFQDKDGINKFNKELDAHCKVPVLSAENLKDKVTRNGRFILRSLSTDPYFNLAMEDYIFQNTPLQKSKSGIKTCENIFMNERLLLYTNRNCVVIGKNQNPWKEVHLDVLKAKGYDFLRRRSGGGSVVHDLGNVNYFYLTSSQKFNRGFFNEQLVKWLSPYNSNIYLNERKDIFLEGKKVSGSAFKIAKGKAYHHGTMLINSQLSEFSKLLKPKDIPDIGWDCPSVASVRSPVGNLFGKGIDTVDQFLKIVVSGFRELMPDTPFYYCDESSSTPDIDQICNELKSDKWKYMNSPNFTLYLGDFKIFVRGGVVTESDIPNTVGLSFVDFIEAFNNKIYGDVINVTL